ncbi:MAG TPA: electron transport complex subunit RsxC [Firmicutes bacterium]|nr:electron transport complex subunit RsxC [Candidatus Fermentithermobacillaceae bacterium]
MVLRTRALSGGVHLDDRKISSGKPVEFAGIPPEIVLFMSQHTGAPAKPVVKAGDHVLAGQVVGEAQSFVSASVHASTSGTVKAVEDRYHPILAKPSTAVVIEPDGKGEIWEGIAPGSDDISTLSPEDIVKIARNAGLVGLGGAAFPTAVKLSPPKDKPIDVYLLNGAECEPYLTCDARLMVEEADEIVFGFRAMMKAVGAPRGIVCIEDNKPEAIMAMERAISGKSGIELCILKTRYPQGGEKQLIQVVLGREVPPPPGLPFDVGVVVSNVGTAYSLAKAIRTGMPLVDRVVTVTGAVGSPSNFRVLLGTPVSFLIEKAGGYTGEPGKVIMGGPMMGISLPRTDVPVLKGTTGIVVMTKDEVNLDKPLPCIRCGRCVDSCPLRLLPVWIAAYSDRGMYEEAEKYRALDCCECGVCAYRCPSRRPLVQSIRLAKQAIMEERRARAQKVSG